MKRTVTLRTKFMGALTLTMILLLVANLIWGYQAQKNAMENELLEESRTLSTMMTSVWDFASINKEAINTSSSGEYDYKGLHCSLVGKAVGAIFSKNSEYSFRFVNFNPRNPDAQPDEYEAEAVESFISESSVEYYGFSEYRGKPVFRYAYAMEVKKNCLECHGAPAGEIDISGYPKEGWGIGDFAGAGSIIIPIEIPQQNMDNNILQSVVFYCSTVVITILLLYLAISFLVLLPMRRLQTGFRVVGKGDIDYRLDNPSKSLYATREMASVFYSFNNMTSELSSLYHSLEDRVTQRTEELSEANKELELQRERLRVVNDSLQVESRHKTDFLAMVSHELRTPLTSILAFAELLRSTLNEEGTDADEQLAKIIRNSHHLIELINNLLDSARIESGKQHVQNEIVDLYDIAGEATSLIMPLAIESGITLQTFSEKNIPLIESDPELIMRILQNLLSNAIKYTPENGFVTIRLDSDKAHQTVILSVSDTGIGILEEQQKSIFDRFVQGDVSTSHNKGGSGLGLALCREIVTLLGGSIAVESKEGQGSTFAVTLPIKIEESDRNV